jgi:hypothetical protein
VISQKTVNLRLPHLCKPVCENSNAIFYSKNGLEFLAIGGFACLNTGTVGSYLLRGMDISQLFSTFGLSCVGSGLATG